MSEYTQKAVKEVIAKTLGANLISQSSESSAREYLLAGKRIVLKIVGISNSGITITYMMLERLDGIIVVFEMVNDLFDVYYIDTGDFKRYMLKKDERRPPLGIMGRSKLKMHGRYLERVSLTENHGVL